MPHSRIADVLGESIQSAFVTLCNRRYGGPIGMRRVENADASSPTAIFRFDGPLFTPIEASVTVCHVGGNMYEVKPHIGSGTPPSFSYCLSEAAPLLVPKTPRLAHEIATYVLDEVERQLGGELIRTELSPESHSKPSGSPSGSPRAYARKKELPADNLPETERRSEDENTREAN